MSKRKKEQESSPGHPQTGMRPGGPNNPDTGYNSGPTTVGPTTGAPSAAELTGGGTGGDIDLPDLTGRGSTVDVIWQGKTGRDTQSAALTGPKEQEKDQHS